VLRKLLIDVMGRHARKTAEDGDFFPPRGRTPPEEPASSRAAAVPMSP